MKECVENTAFRFGVDFPFPPWFSSKIESGAIKLRYNIIGCDIKTSPESIGVFVKLGDIVILLDDAHFGIVVDANKPDDARIISVCDGKRHNS
jgi:hypothetical protein